MHTLAISTICSLMLPMICHAMRMSQHMSAVTGGSRLGTHAVQPTLTGQLPIIDGRESLYFAFWEAHERPGEDEGQPPIILWLQGGPGCASTFGAFYELGPYSITADLDLIPNPGAWNHRAALLVIDQPLGTGFSWARNNSLIPSDELSMATQLYTALQHFFDRFWHLRDRPFFITGESYGGKYVPSLAHFILQAQHALPGRQQPSPPPLRHLRQLPLDLTPPLFKLSGIAVGNGLTSPHTQTLTLASVAWWTGLVNTAVLSQLEAQARQVIALMEASKWREAHKEREALRKHITKAAGIATMFDMRRTQDYDPRKSVDAFLNLPEIRDALAVSGKGVYQSCSDEVEKVMEADIMQSVAHLVPDLLAHIPVLLYQGQYDIVDGPVSNSAWIEEMTDWPQLAEFLLQNSTLWYCPGSCTPGGAANGSAATNSTDNVGGWWRQAGLLTHAVIYRAGHMVPHDQPVAMLHLLQSWMLQAMEGVRS